METCSIKGYCFFRKGFIMNREKVTIDMVLFRQKRQEVALLYDLYFDYYSNEVFKGNSCISDSFIVTAAFSCVFSCDLKLVAGLCSFTASINNPLGRIIVRLSPHHWLSWRDENHIIDIIPLDGVFGISVPQAIFQRRDMMRYFPLLGIFPKDWNNNERTSFDNKVSEVVAILEDLMQKISS